MGPPPGPALASPDLWPPVYSELRPGNPGTEAGGEVSSSWARDNMGSRLHK